MGIGGGLWVVRYRSKSSKPMKLPKARTYALEMVRGVRPGMVIADPIGRLHRLHLDVHEFMPHLACGGGPNSNGLWQEPKALTRN